MSPFSPLICHPADVPPAGLAIAAEARPAGDGGLQFAYDLSGISELNIPPPALPQAIDGLWQHTCCEAFVAGENGSGYHEFNFSPSGCWAAYRFHRYRDRNTAWTPSTLLVVESDLQADNDRLRLIARVPASLLPDSPKLSISLTTVIEDREGRKTYWALAHAAPSPDFHCRDSFTLALNRP